MPKNDDQPRRIARFWIRLCFVTLAFLAVWVAGMALLTSVMEWSWMSVATTVVSCIIACLWGYIMGTQYAVTVSRLWKKG